MTCLILCGGAGSRLWPLSRNAYPKQFVKFLHDTSLFEKTINRNKELCDNFLIVTNEKQSELAIEQVKSAGLSLENTSFILEPIGRNTAPAIALACMALDPKELVLVVPSDHEINNEKKYYESCEKASLLAQNDYLVTFGLKPTYPETGYGYIEVDSDQVLDIQDACEVISFREKPDTKTAERFIQKGNFFWNSGMFLFSAEKYLEELKTHAPDIFIACEKTFHNAKQNIQNSLKIIEPKVSDMEKIPANSIDYAVMEKSKKVACIKSNFTWNDLGSFDSLYEVLEKDTNGNTFDKNLIQYNTKNNLVISTHKTIALVDIEDLIIVETEDALLITKRGKSQNVKKIVESLKIGNELKQKLL